MTFRMLYAAPYLALVIPVSARLHEAGTQAVSITAKGFDRGPTGWKSVMRSVKASKKARFDDEQADDNEKTTRLSTRDPNCVAWKDARFLDYPHDGLFQYEDFTNSADADIFFAE